MLWFGKEVESKDLNKVADTVAANLKAKIDKLLQTGINEEVLSQQEANELKITVGKLSKNRYTEELTDFGNTLIQIDSFWKTYLPKFATIKTNLERGILKLTRSDFYVISGLVNQAVELFKNIEKNIRDEENKDWSPWDHSVGKASLEDMAHEDDALADAAIDLISDLEVHAERLKKLVDLTFAELMDLENYLHNEVQPTLK